MNNYIKQHVFDENNIRLFYLSPYTEIRVIENEIVFMRQESNMVVTLPSKGEISLELVEMLKNGIAEEMLKMMLSDLLNEKCEDWLYSCIWEGIIE